MKKSISLFVHCFPPAKGGAEYLSQKIAEVLNNKYEVHIFTGRGETLDSYKNFDHYIIDNVPKVHRLELNFLLQKFANKFLNKIIFKVGFFSPFYFGPILKYSQLEKELIQKSELIVGIAMPTKSFYDAYSFAKKYKKKLILIPAYHNVNYYNGCFLFQKAFDYSNKILYLTPFEKIELQKNYKINSNKMHQATFSPFSLKEINEQKNQIVKTVKEKVTNISSKKITLGFIGQITHRKNLTLFKDYLNKYLPYWNTHGFAFNVLFSGSKTNSSTQIEMIFKDYINNHSVKINYDFKVKEKEFEKIDIFINPSSEESLSIVNFEAIFFGLPILINSTSAFSSIVRIPEMQFDNIDQLHQRLLTLLSVRNKYSSTIKKQYEILTNYNIDNFNSSINQLI